MTYQETIEYLYATAPMFQSIGSAGYKEGLETTHTLDTMLDHPHRAYRTIHVGGTNGKGSTSQMLASVLRAAGYSVGLYTSPHLKDFRERMRVNGSMISEQQVIEFIERMRPTIDELRPSFFEITTAMAFDYFRHERVDIAVIEVGMGGRLDCTNIITPMVSIITNIGMDHMGHLGNTIPLIAAEKAGIIKEGVPVVVGEQQPESAPTLIARAHEQQTSLQFASLRYRCEGHTGRMFEVQSLLDGYRFTIELGMEGDYQQRNLCTTLTALDLLTDPEVQSAPLEITSAAVRRGLADARVAGRWHKISTDGEPLTICDTGHNVDGMEYVVRQIAQQSFDKLYFVLGVVADKDLDAILGILPRDAHYIFTRSSLPRAMPAEELARRCTDSGLIGNVALTVPEALSLARSMATPQDMIFVGGSTFTVAEIL